MAVNDIWGAVSIPTAASAAGQAAGDPCLSYILAFLHAFVTTDANATAAWSPVFPSKPPIAATFPHNPADVAFSANTLPALYMWRDSAKQEREADDWLHEVTTVKALWVFPLGLQDNQRLRTPFVNALCKAIAVGIERGRTPGWIVAGDTDPAASSQGSNLYTWTNFEHFFLQSWRRTALVIPAVDGTTRESYAAIELTFELAENLEYGIDGLSPDYQNAVTVSQTPSYILSATYDVRPLSVLGLTGWWADTIATDGSGNLTTWTDLSGLGHDLPAHIIQPFFPTAPTVTASAINGHAAATFTATDLSHVQEVKSSFNTSTLFSASAHQQYVLVNISSVQRTVTIGDANGSCDGIVGDSQIATGLYVSAAGPTVFAAAMTGPTGSATEVNVGTSAPLGKWFVATTRHQSGALGIRVGTNPSVPFVEVPCGDVNFSPITPATFGNFEVGSQGTHGSRSDVAYLATFNRALSAAEDEFVLRCLRTHGALSF